jgi:hypothetical protein
MQLSACWLLAGISLAALVAGVVAARVKLPHADAPPPPQAAAAGTKLASTAAAAGVSPKQHSTSTAGQQQQRTKSSDASDPRLGTACAFLNAHLPQRDSGRISQQRLRQHAQLALAARDATPWAAAVPWPLWLNDVLPYRSMDEPLDEQDWRPLFFKRFMPLVAQAQSLGEAAQILNRCVRVGGGVRHASGCAHMPAARAGPHVGVPAGCRGICSVWQQLAGS